MANTGKLITPVQYERGLDGLNTLRPLSKVDTVRRVVSLPVVNSIPVNNPRIAQGRLLRCSQQGAVLGTKNRYYNWGEIITTSAEDETTFVQIVFSQKVGGLLVWYWESAFIGSIRIITYPNRILIKNWGNVGLYWFPFVGTNFWVRVRAQMGGKTSVRFYGFY